MSLHIPRPRNNFQTSAVIRTSGEQLRYQPACPLHQWEQGLSQPAVFHVGWDEQALLRSDGKRLRYEPLGSDGGPGASQLSPVGMG